MALTPNQKAVVKKFRKHYFTRQEVGGNAKIPLEDFLDKTKQEQEDFIKVWAEERYNKMITIDTNLVAQRARVATQKQVAKDALADWGVTVP